MNDKVAIKKRWGLFRLEVIEPLLRGSVEKGNVQQRIRELSELEYRHPQHPQRSIRLGLSTIERWYYSARNTADPLATLTGNLRSNAGKPLAFSDALLGVLERQYATLPLATVKELYMRLAKEVADNPHLGKLPSYMTVLRWVHVLQRQHSAVCRRNMYSQRSVGGRHGEEPLHRITEATDENDYDNSAPSHTDYARIGCLLADEVDSSPRPDTESLINSFRREIILTQRKSNGTVTVHGLCYKVPSRFGHLTRLSLRCSEWDATQLLLMNPDTGAPACLLPIHEIKRVGSLEVEVRDLARKRKTSK